MIEPLTSFSVVDGMISFRVADASDTTADDLCMEAEWDGGKWLLSIVRDRGMPHRAACPAPIVDLELPLPEPLDREPWVLVNQVVSCEGERLAGGMLVGGRYVAAGLN